MRAQQTAPPSVLQRTRPNGRFEAPAAGFGAVRGGCRRHSGRIRAPSRRGMSTWHRGRLFRADRPPQAGSHDRCFRSLLAASRCSAGPAPPQSGARPCRPPAPAAGAGRSPPGRRCCGVFDPPDRPWLSGHRGVDLRAASDGAPVTAPAAGTVSFVGVVVDRPVLTIDHGDGLRSSFEPVDSDLRPGDAVARGAGRWDGVQPGHCGGTPACTGASGAARST